MNSVAPGFGADIKNLVAYSASTSQKNTICFDQSQTECIDQIIAVVAGIKINFPADSWNAGAVAITGDAIDHTIEQKPGTWFFQFAES